MCARDLRHGSSLYTDALAENHTAGLGESVEYGDVGKILIVIISSSWLAGPARPQLHR